LIESECSWFEKSKRVCVVVGCWNESCWGDTRCLYKEMISRFTYQKADMGLEMIKNSPGGLFPALSYEASFK
jgi:hypothetical protein